MKDNERKKQISAEISISILTVIAAIFTVFCVVVAVMIASISLSTQKDELELQSKAASYQLETFFKKYVTVVDQMALNPDVKKIMSETGATDNITEQELWDDVFAEMLEVRNYDDANILASWIADVDSNVLVMSDGYVSDSSFDITTRAWYEAAVVQKSILTSAYTDASTGKLVISAAAPVYGSGWQQYYWCYRP